MDYAFIQSSAAPVRRKADHRSEMVNQLLFGESVSILKKKDDGWVKVQSLHDHYKGWLTANHLLPATFTQVSEPIRFVSSGTPGIISKNGKRMWVPAGAGLPMFEPANGDTRSGIGMIGDDRYEYTGPFIDRYDVVPFASRVETIGFTWLNAPYLWGGRTLFGIDCSGLIQLTAKLGGIDLPRDAWQQARIGKRVKKMDQLLPGDLLFFHRKKKITHVGIYLGEKKVLHSSGRVRIDTLDKKGLIDAATGERLRPLHSMRRIS